MGALIVAGFVGVALIEPIANVWDDHTTPQPWLEVAISEERGGIAYHRIINRWMRGVWVAVVQVRRGDAWKGVCTGNGAFTYRPHNSGTELMTFEYFTGGCAMPAAPHRVCVDYVMQDRRGRQRDFGPFCTL